MNKRTAGHYRKFRAIGEPTAQALNSARTLTKWELLEDAGFVRIIAQPDESPDLSYLDDWTETRGDRASAKKAREQAENDGVWGVVGQFRTHYDPTVHVAPSDNEWTTSDSVWNCSGYRDVTSPFENCYVTDIMHETMKEFRKEWKSFVRGLCQACEGTEKRGVK